MKKIIYIIKEFSLGDNGFLENHSHLILHKTQTTGEKFGLPKRNPDVLELTDFYRTQDFNEIVSEIKKFKKTIDSCVGTNVNFTAFLRIFCERQRNYKIYRVCSPDPEKLIKRLDNENIIYCVIEKY